MGVRIEDGWHRALADVWPSEWFGQLSERVHAEYASGGRIYPPSGKVFAAFDACPFDQTKVVIIGQDPYHGPGQANGLCFSVRSGVMMPPSLVNIFKEVSAETGAPMPADGDLTRWARQGVLLLNSSLTVREHQPKSHSGIGWERFTDECVHRLADRREGLVFMLWGADAIRKGSFIDRGRHLVLTSAHPSPLSAYRGFFGNGHFNAANEYLRMHGKEPIKW